jgi:hypothetical protein
VRSLILFFIVWICAHLRLSLGNLRSAFSVERSAFGEHANMRFALLALGRPLRLSRLGLAVRGTVHGSA